MLVVVTVFCFFFSGRSKMPKIKTVGMQKKESMLHLLHFTAASQLISLKGKQKRNNYYRNK